MAEPLRVLLVEDDENDALLVVHALRQGGFEPRCERVEVEVEFRSFLLSREWDVVIADYDVPQFGAFPALEILHELKMDVPLIMVSGVVGEESAVRAMKAGACDFLVKERLHRLVPVIQRELRERCDRQQRRAAEAALRASEQRRVLHVKHTPLGVIEWDLNFRVLAWNAAAEQIFGYSADEVLGKQADFMVTPTAKQEVIEAWSNLLTGKGGRYSENEHVTRDRRIILCQWYNTALVDDEGRVIGVASLVQDVTEKRATEAAVKESEQRYRMLLENSEDLICELNADGEYLYVNSHYRSVLGYEPEELIGICGFDLVHPEDLQNVLREFGRQRGSHLLRFRHRNGDWIWFESAGQRFTTSSGEERSVVISRNVTERLEAEARHSHLEAQLRQAQKMEAIGTLAGGIAHDFNNILAAIIPYAHLAMEDAAGNRPVCESLEQILAAADRAKHLVQQILAFSRQQKQERRSLRLQSVIKETIKLLRSALPSTHEIRSSIDDNAPAVEADPTQIHQVLMNLCANAEHAMRGRHGVLGITLDCSSLSIEEAQDHPELKPGEYVRLSVADNGIGMDADTMKRMFDPFFTTKEAGEGTGLGLAVVHGIIRDHGGSITAESSPDTGSCFRVLLPARGEAPGVDTPLSQDFAQGNGEQILFVDDEASIGRVAQRGLERAGYRVEVFHDPQVALAEFEAHPDRYDLLFTDLTMPVITGVELVERIRRVRTDIPVILSTGFEGGLTTSDLRRVKVHRLLQKPVSPQVMAQTVSEVLQEVREAGRGKTSAEQQT